MDYEWKAVKKRINMTIDAPLHQWAVKHAKTELGADFSGYVSLLISSDRGRVRDANRLVARIAEKPDSRSAKGA